MIISLRHSTLVHGQPFGGQRRLVTSPAAAAAGAARSQQQRPRHVQDLSMLLLVNKNLERHLNRGLLDPSQLLDACRIVDQSDYALLVIGSQSSSNNNSVSVSGSSSSAQQDMPLWPVLFANAAAVAAFASTNSASEQQPGSCAHGSGSSSSGGAVPLQDTQQLQHIPLPTEVLIFLQQQQQQQQQSAGNNSSSSSSSSSTTANCTCGGSTVLQDVVWQYNSAVQQQLDQALTIKQLVCCHVHAPNDAYLGLALLFDAWQHSDGCLGVPGWPHVAAAVLPTQQQLQQAADAVRDQAEAVRHLKQGQGLGNKDPAVVDAVAALQQLKQQLTHLEGLHQAFSTERQGTLQQLVQLAKQQAAQKHQQQQQ